MKLLDEVKYLRKDAIYEDYYKIIKNFKDYDKITTKKMLETIIDLYNQEGYLTDFLTIEEIAATIPEEYIISSFLNSIS